MRYRKLGSTNLQVSALAFGAGPVSGLMTNPGFDSQKRVVQRAIELGLNWFDTAATYGAGESEKNLGHVLESLRNELTLPEVHLATKVRVASAGVSDFRPIVLQSVRESLTRLRVPRVTLLQLHNSITRVRDSQPTSVTPEDVLGPAGILAGMEMARTEGLVDHFGLTGIGEGEGLREVIRSEKFATIQTPLHLLNMSPLKSIPVALQDPDYGGFLRDAANLGMGIFAIRVFAGGALIGSEPSAHTLKTPFFPLSLYERDRTRLAQLRKLAGSVWRGSETALRYILSQSEVTSAIVGFGSEAELDEACASESQGNLSDSEIGILESSLQQLS